MQCPTMNRRDNSNACSPGLHAIRNITGYVLIRTSAARSRSSASSRISSSGLEMLLVGPLRRDEYPNQGGIRPNSGGRSRRSPELLPASAALRRVSLPISKLILAMNCGGSLMGASGITANPALGVASDELVRHGATSVLAETPKFMAPSISSPKDVRREVGKQLMEWIRWWEDHARQHGASIDNNPVWETRPED